MAGDGAAQDSARLLSLDAFRGFDVAAMLLVNMSWNEAVFPRQLFHVPWNDPVQGATFTDLVFPWFVFIAGAAMPFSLRKQQERGATGCKTMVRALQRGAILYLWGVLLTVASDAYTTPLQWTDLLQWNILQLIGVAYVVAVGVWLLPVGCRWAFVIVVLWAKWALMTLPPWELVNGLIETRALPDAPLGPSTWAHFDAIQRVAKLEHWPNGCGKYFLGWWGVSQEFLPLAAITVSGAGVATALARSRTWWRVLQVVLGGVLATALAVVLQWNYGADGTGLWGRFTVPFSKWFFSPAYCLLAVGTGTLLLAAFFGVMDVARWTTAWPLRVLGMNAIALYVGAELSFKTIFSKWQIPVPTGGTDSIASGYLAWVAHATGSPAIAGWSFVALWLGGWWLFCYWLWRRGIFLRV